MAELTPILTEVAKLAEEFGNEASEGGIEHSYSNIRDARRERQRARRIEALSLKLAGVSTAQIADRVGIQPDTVRKLINRTLRTARTARSRKCGSSRMHGCTALRPLSWSNVLAGDYRAVMIFLQICQRRAKLNGLDCPAPMVLSSNVRGEMERALADLQQVVLGGEIEPLADDRPD